MPDQKLAGAYIEITTKGIEVGPQIEKLKADVNRALPANEDSGQMEKILFGKHGSAGIEHTLLHLAGQYGKIFAAGGLFQIGTIVTEKLTEALAEQAFGFEKSARAAEDAAKRLEHYKEASESANKAAVAAQPGRESPLPLSRAEKLAQVGKELSEAESENAKAATNDLSPAELKQIKDSLGDQHTLQEEKDAREAAIRQRRNAAIQRVESARHAVAHLGNELVGDTANSFMGGMATLGQNVFRGGRNQLALGANALQNQFLGNPLQQQMNAARLPNLQDQLRANAGQGFNLDHENVEGLQKRGQDIMARQTALEERKHMAELTSHAGQATDIGSIGAQIQAAILESPFQQEQMRLDKERNELLTEIARRGPMAAGVAVVAPNR